MDNDGGVDNLDNRRREVSPERMKELEKLYGIQNQSSGNSNGGN